MMSYGRRVIVRCAFDDVFVGRICAENEVAYFVVNEDMYESIDGDDLSELGPICGHYKERVYQHDEEWIKNDDHDWENLTLFDSQVFLEK
ncbi:MAG: hypothetical protein J4F48_12455 [Nitrospinae bacterium]|nr:hypothetical protein [Nitrospinota bacterium]